MLKWQYKDLRSQTHQLVLTHILVNMSNEYYCSFPGAAGEDNEEQETKVIYFAVMRVKKGQRVFVSFTNSGNDKQKY